MMFPDDAIAITGLGLASSLGLTPEQTFDAICAGSRGIGPMPALEQTPSPDLGGGQARPLAAADEHPNQRAAVYLRFVIAQALAHAGHPERHPGRDPSRIAVVMGTTLHGMRAGGSALRSGDLTLLRDFPAGAVLAQAASLFNIKGPLISTCSACSSGLGAIALAVTLLRSGDVDLVIAGGYDTVSEYVYAGFNSLRLVASGPPRPFSAAREGMKTAEGYAALILERHADAQAREARSRGFIAGFGESADAHHLTKPRPDGGGAASAIRAALADAGSEPASIGLISAHATATPDNDAAEYAALEAAFGDTLAHTPVVAFKSHLGHTLGGAGAVELVLAVLARERGLIPPTINAEPIDPAFSKLKLQNGELARAPISATLGLSLGFGGANTCIVVTSRPPQRPVRRFDADAATDPVITGLGIVIPGAIGREAFIRLLGAKAAPLIPAERTFTDDQLAGLINARRVRRMSEYVKLTLAATQDACSHAGISDLPAFAADACVLLGTNHGSSNFCESYYGQVVREGIAAANPVLFAEGVPNAGAAQLSLALGVRGGCQTIIGSRAAGLDALHLAALRIRQGLWSRAFVGAAEEHCPTVARAYAACGLLPEDAFGGGAVTLILEARAAAIARGARILATIGRGSARSGPPHHAMSGFMKTSEDHRPAPLFTALGSSQPDRAVKAALAHTTAISQTSIASMVPELFSVGSLVALASAILNPSVSTVSNPPERVMDVLATDFWDGAVRVRFRVPN